MVALILTPVGGCRVEPEPALDSATTASGDYTVRYEFEPDPIPRNEHFVMHVLLSRKDGLEFAPGLSVVVDADMPAHGHGINTQPEVTMVSPGVYKVEGLLFHMGGQWELFVDVMEDGIPDRATIRIKM